MKKANYIMLDMLCGGGERVSADNLSAVLNWYRLEK